ncbi:MAG: DJ-1/PfpI family protein [Oxalicibacterium faecigallinarum]|uniref:AraC family transcriptional regulator n=1 Tax=Oxalicibacterium faecigallinarum TaxID=573741 RepID=A0A8J3ATH8_9BURK|nr:DJ-1/PfpI family protein [Oxalicibacterium faecigallinarum]MDQ7970842.1 DJ-1/PfpI family protein [Oxalicibacterium faecigallinarum]GGI18315.1 AraC family transcriptional regulator [Oxalicibacterium faecigallinarum]
MLFGVFIYEGVEPVDLATYGVLSMARRIQPAIRICTIAPNRGVIAFSNGLMVQADYGIADAPKLDVLIVTGGPGWMKQAEDQATLRFLRERASSTIMSSVCTGAMILAASGVLDGKIATTKKEVVEPEYPPIKRMQETYAAIDVRPGSIIDNGSVITGGGVTLCIDTTLHLLEKLFGAETAAETARIMEYTVARDANAHALPPIIQKDQNDRQDFG